MSKSPNARAVSTDALETLGKIHEREEKRDAIHLAVEPVIAGEVLQPGQHMRDAFQPDEFWPRYERVTGRTVGPDKQYSFFSCSC
jgi:hypothetical protein